MVIKVVIGTKKGKCLQKELSEDESKLFHGLKIGDKVSGQDIGFSGYEFEIAGGSDNCGFPMRRDVDGAARKRILEVEGVGLKKKAKGIRQRKTVCGNTVHDKISQVNLRILKEGAQPLIEEKEEPKEGEAPKEGSAEQKEEPKEGEAPKEGSAEQKEEPKEGEAPKEGSAEQKEEPKVEEKPAEEPKSEAKPEEKPAEPAKEEKKEEKPAE